MNFKTIIGKINVTLLELKNLINIDKTIFYQISTIDLETQTALLHIKHKNIFIKQTFSEIISTPSVLEGLSCKHACWIGIYYGKALRNALKDKKKLKNINKPSYLLKHKRGLYKIISENRDGTIDCLQIRTKRELNASPLLISQDENLIKLFDPSQACYIGILAGIEISKKERRASDTNSQYKTPYLRIVK